MEKGMKEKGNEEQGQEEGMDGGDKVGEEGAARKRVIPIMFDQ
jgi:hypothetical protein